jgi:putative radical SAM enzyme (TIGR03279 family)
VLTPGLNDGPHLDRTLKDLAGLYPSVRSCSVVPVGITRFHRNGIRPYAPAAMEAVIRQVERSQKEFLPTLGSRFAFLTDEWYLATGRSVPELAAYEGLDLRENGLGLARSFLDDWDTARRRLAGSKIRSRYAHATLVTAKLFQKTLESAAAEFSAVTGIPLRVIGVPNGCFGETVTVAGLLTARDVIEALRQTGPAGPVLLPRVMFRHPDTIALDDLSPLDVAQATDLEVYLVEAMSGVADSLCGKTPCGSELEVRGNKNPPGGGENQRVLSRFHGMSAIPKLAEPGTGRYPRKHRAV